MSERYATLFKCVVPQSQKNSPVLLSAGVLLGDKQTGSVLAQIKFQNVGDKSITAVYASLICIDAMNESIVPDVDARYLDLNVKPGAFFADRQPVIITNTTARRFLLRITNIMFEDGTAWKNEEDTRFEVIPEFQNTYTAEQLDQLRFETGKREFVTSEATHEYIKRCHCGQWNLLSNSVCVKCHCNFSKICACGSVIAYSKV